MKLKLRMRSSLYETRIDGMEAEATATGGVGGVLGHPGTENVAEVIDQDQEVETDQVEVEDVLDREKGRNEKKDENGKRKDYPQSKRDIYQFAAQHYGLVICLSWLLMRTSPICLGNMVWLNP
jgi:hypothetical protein